MPNNRRGSNALAFVVDGGVIYPEQTRVKKEVNFVPINENNLHGTMVAQIITQVAPFTETISLRVTDKKGGTDIKTVIDSIEYALSYQTSKTKIINISLGTEKYDQDLKNVCDRAEREGVIIVCSTGNNSGVSLRPASFESTISVGGSDKNNRVSKFSNRSRREELDVLAPAENITAIKTMSGTSFAAPIVTGIIALMCDVRPVSTKEAKQALRATAYDVEDKGWDRESGAGIVQAEGAVDWVRGNAKTSKEVILKKLDFLIKEIEEIKKLL